MSFFSALRWQDIADFLVLTLALYVLLLWAKQTRALRFAVIIVGLHACALWAMHFDLRITGWVLEGASLAVIGLLILLFQEEVRHSVARFDSSVRLWLSKPPASNEACAAIGEAVFAMARGHIGALIVVTRKEPVTDLVTGGVKVDAALSPELLEAIFEKSSPIHDGAVIINQDRIQSAGVILPLSERKDVPSEYGTRHRAGMGLAERCDAQVLVVSEERGKVVLMEGCLTSPMPDVMALQPALSGPGPSPRVSLRSRLSGLLFRNLRYRLAAVGLAMVIWALSFVRGDMIVKNVVAPTEFANLPPGLLIANQPAGSVKVQLRGNTWMMNPMMNQVLSSLTVRIDLSGLEQGPHTIRLTEADLKLPPGVRAEHITPETVSVRLTRRDVP
jgi:uncharacterized protein (TIGR00159 family)